MQKHFFKFKKVFTNIAFYPLIFISNNLELAAKFLPNEVDDSITTLEINNIKNSFQQFNIQREKNIFIAENEKKNVDQERVLISEIIIEGWENHPEGRKLELAAYDSMSIKPCLLYTSPSPRD